VSAPGSAIGETRKRARGRPSGNQGRFGGGEHPFSRTDAHACRRSESGRQGVTPIDRSGRSSLGPPRRTWPKGSGLHRSGSALGTLQATITSGVTEASSEAPLIWAT
jgi:hypothetical protein